MAELQTLARPYAEAAFKLASVTQDVAAWSQALERMAAVVDAARSLAVVGHPCVDHAALADALADAAGDLGPAQRQFLHVLASNERLLVLPQVAAQFEGLHRASQGVLRAEISTAFPLDSEQLAQVVATLEARYGQKVDALVQVDTDLIGGVSIRIGDEVVDASVRGKLAQLADVLMN
jgi:F-type H+-transporting ATPase subunit delta